MRNVKAGALRHRLTILNNAGIASQDAFGESNANFQPNTTVWGSIEPLKGRELEWAQMVRADLTHKVTMRYVGYVSPMARMQYGTRVFNIYPGMNTEERNRVVIFYAVEVDP